MRSFRKPGAALAVLVLALGAAACGGDDDGGTEPRPDAGVASMTLTVGDRTISVDSAGAITGSLDTLPFGPTPVSATFQGGNLTGERYVFEVVFGDTLALDWTDGPGFTGTLTARAAGTYTMTFRLRDSNDSGTEIFLTRMLDIDVGVERVRMIFGPDTLLIDPDASLPVTLDDVPVGAVPVSIDFLGASGAPAPLITGDAFSVLITSSDTNIIAYTPEGPFSGTLRGVSPGVASLSVRLRSEANGGLSFAKVLTVVVAGG